MKRPTFEEYGMVMALSASIRSEDRYVKVGCVAFDKDKKIKATGYNGFGEGQELSDEFHCNRDKRRLFVRHAECNCLSLTLKGDIEHLFVTTSPCQPCAQNISAHKIKNVYFCEVYDKDPSYKEIFDFYGINYKQISKESIVPFFKDIIGEEVVYKTKSLLTVFKEFFKGIYGVCSKD